MDEFAQSREDDDLFADEFEPIAGPTIVEEPSQHVPDQQSTSEGSGETGPTAKNEQAGFNASTNGSGSRGAQRPQQGRGRGGRGGRGRGDGRGGDEFRSSGLSQSRYADPAPAQASAPPLSQTQIQSQSQSSEPPSSSSTNPPSDTPTTTTTTQQSTNNNATTNTNTITNTSTNTEPRIHAVRGDRSATGGPAHKKLTEEELSAKMAAMAILNAKKTERHRLTEADSAAFERREKEQQKKRVEEQKSRREMDMERAKNRERKLKAQGGREWDEGKVESDIVDRTMGRSSQYVRGGHGGVIRGSGRGGLAGSRYSEAGDDLVHGPPARGGRGGGGFNIRGRGGKARGGSPALPVDADFPALPSAKGITSPVSDKAAGDWAEEMATPIEEKSLA